MCDEASHYALIEIRGKQIKRHERIALSQRPRISHGNRVLGWTKSGMNYLAVSELGEQEFQDFVKMIQAQTVDSRPGE